MSVITWDETGSRQYETGIKNCVLYPQATSGAYEKGVAWNGLTAVTESPSGAEPTALWADDMKYAELMSTEEFGGTIEAYMSPEEFDACDGSVQISPGVSIGQQTRKAFGFCYRSIIGNDVEGEDFGYKLHLIYGAKASVSEKAYQTINESPEAMTLSWEFTTTPVKLTAVDPATNKPYKPTATLTINSTTADPTKIKALEDILYGTESEEPRLPSPDEVIEMFKAA